MTFLQPYVLWALPLILLPVVIHLLNRMRHRPQPWAAMRFLVSATRSSVNNARLRQWLILFCRVLAVLLLILFLSRPLAGGWLGWALAPAPDAILILLDRSASMESLNPGGNSSRREAALRSLAEAAKPFEETSRLVLIESAFRLPQEIGRAASLKEMPLTSPTDTAADIPALVASALSWIIENRAGTVELWLASDLQRSNWQPEDPRWPNLVAQLNSLPQKVHIRLLALNQSGQPNRSVGLKEALRRSRGAKNELQFTIDVQASTPRSETVPLSVKLDGAPIEKELKLEGQSMRWRSNLNLSDKTGNGWGSFTIPADGNSRDNTAYFVYGSEPLLRASIISSDRRAARLLQLAIGAGSKKAGPVAKVVSGSTLEKSIWEDNTLLVWQEEIPTGANAQRVRAFAEQGGTVLCLPPGHPVTNRFEGLGWGNIDSADADRPFRILRWNQEEGPLAKSDEGLSLPLAQTVFLRRQAIIGAKNVLAAFEDGTPFLARQPVGRGEILFCATLPEGEWSTLEDGPVLVPMMQRLLEAGSRRLQQALSINCGELNVADQGRRWETIDSTIQKDIRTQAGVYKSGEQLLAVNRPGIEDDLEMIEAAEAKRLFGPLALQMLEEKRSARENLQGEIWKVFLGTMLLFLIAEGALMLPPNQAANENANRHGLRAAKVKREAAQ